jgi:hypothetical protein
MRRESVVAFALAIGAPLVRHSRSDCAATARTRPEPGDASRIALRDVGFRSAGRRHACCSTLSATLTKGAHKMWLTKKILAPTDFSASSQAASDAGLELGSRAAWVG